MTDGQNMHVPLMTASRDEMCYCPGCSHAVLLEHVGAALGRLKLRPDNVCLISDIGCIGTADRYFSCHTFHGLHGRSITYAEGIKRVRPETTTVVLIGDGGCGIGTAHLVHAARRGMGVKVVVCNNFNFGMTGGQYSPTTPRGAHTVTAPNGLDEQPLDVCQTVLVNGASYVARCSALNPDCVDYIEGALRSPGFALVDVWELCTAYFVPANKFKPQTLQEVSQRFNMPFGVLRSENGAPVKERPAQSAPAAPPPSPRNTPRLRWPGRTEICVAGSAGQRIRSAAGTIGEIAVAAGLHAAQMDDFPITVRRGHSVSYLVLSDKPIRYMGVDEPDVVMLLSPDGQRRVGSLNRLPKKCRLFADARLADGELPESAHRLDYQRIEKEAGKASAAMAALTYAIVRSGHVDAKELMAAAQAALTGKYREENLRAMQVGVALADTENLERLGRVSA